MDELNKLETELRQMLENIKDVREYVKDNKDVQWKPYSSHVFGELKHRASTLKRRLTKIQGKSTQDLWTN